MTDEEREAKDVKMREKRLRRRRTGRLVGDEELESDDEEWDDWHERYAKRHEDRENRTKEKEKAKLEEKANIKHNDL